MKVELKRIQVYKTNSEESHAFSAALFIDGRRAGLVRNDGRGGMTIITPHDAGSNDIIGAARQYCKTLPPLAITEGDSEFLIPMTLELYLDELVDKFAFNQGMQKDMQKGIIVGMEGERYQLYELSRGWKALLNHPKGLASLEKFLVDVIKPAMKQGERVLNLNLPTALLSLVNPPVSQTNQSAKKVRPSRSPNRVKTTPGKHGPA